MKDLIKALEIFDKYGADGMAGGHDVIYIHGVDADTQFTMQEIKELDDYGFFFSEGEDAWISFRWG